MKTSGSELKARARASLTGNYALLIAALLSVSVFTSAANALINIFGGNAQGITAILIEVIVNLLLTVLSSGVFYLYLNVSRGYAIRVDDIFFCFRNHPDKMILISLIFVGINLAAAVPFVLILGVLFLALGATLAELMIAPFVWVILVICAIAWAVLAITLDLTFSQVLFLYIDHPEGQVLDFFRESRRVMTGNRLRLFWLFLSFMGLSLLSVLSCGIAFLWVLPYMNVTLAGFYDDLYE